jgi:cytochrome c oxidase subunit 3
LDTSPASSPEPAPLPSSLRIDRLRVNRVGLWLFFFSESLIFGLLFSSRFFLEGIERGELDQVLGLIITVVLLISSVTAFTAETAMARGNRPLCLWMLLATIVLGILFAAGVVYEWSIAHFTKDEAFGTVFFAMTGMHAFHVISGIVMLLMALALVARGRFGKGDYWGVEGTVKYWHFVDLVWVFYYPALYLTK